MVFPPLGPVYDPVITAINNAKTRLNADLPTLTAITGKILDNPDAYSQQLVNNAWRKMQDYLANRGYSRFIQRAVITPIPISGNTTDPTVQSYMNWFNYFDGVNLTSSPVLPVDFIQPLRLAERITGGNGFFQRMDLWIGELPSAPKVQLNRIWNWSGDQINLPGATLPTDIELYYSATLGDFVDVNTSRWFELTLPVVHGADTLGLYICAEVVGARDNPDLTAAAAYTDAAENAAKLIANRDVRMKARTNIQRRSASGRLEGGCGGLGNGYW